MNMTVTMDEVHNETDEKPGMQLARIREKKGYSQEYIAIKLHLRVRIIELLEADDYESMPEPVFIKGYLRAYAKLLGLSPEPLLAIFNNNFSSERKLEKALWQQSKRESNKGERTARWLTVVVAIGAIIAVSIWWQKNKDSQQVSASRNTHAQTALNKPESEIRLTDLSKMHSVFSSNKSQMTPMEANGG